MKYFLSILIIIVITSCSDNNSIKPPEIKDKRAVIILNEGLYGQNNSTLTVYYPDENEVINDAFSLYNNGEKLGDTGNDIKKFDANLIITVDYSNKLEIISSKDFKRKKMIDLGKSVSPRSVYVLDTSIAFVSSSLMNKVLKINISEGKIIDQYNTGLRPEGIEYYSNKLYVANSGFGLGKTISVIDASNGTLIKEIELFPNPRFIIKDKNNIMYIICTGNYDAVGKGAIYKLNPQNDVLIDSLFINNNPHKSVIFRDSLLLCINGDGINQINLNTFKFDKLLIKGEKINPINSFINSIAYDKNNDLLYFGNPKTFTQNGEVVIFNGNGNEVKRIDCGINPGEIVFK